jgi:acetyl-CoA carboxylase biotin carboxyl carrier protein
MNDSSESQLPDVEYVRELAKVFQEYELDELEIEAGDRRILIRHADYATAPATTIAMAPAPVAAPVAAAPVAAVAARPATGEAAAAPAEAPGDFIISPFVGTFYRSPRPDAASFVEVGKRVQAGETVCIIEAMKLFNEIEADFTCQIEEFLADNGQAVEYGTKLFRVRKL